MSTETKADDRLKSQVRLPIELAGSNLEAFYRLVRNAFNLKTALDLMLVNHYVEDKDTVVALRFVEELPVEAKELGELSGVILREGGELNLRFDPKGELKSYTLEQPTQEAVEHAKHDYQNLLASKQVYFARSGEKIDVSQLAAAGQRFYVQMDASGKKRLHRAYTG